MIKVTELNIIIMMKLLIEKFAYNKLPNAYAFIMCNHYVSLSMLAYVLSLGYSYSIYCLLIKKILLNFIR